MTQYIQLGKKLLEGKYKIKEITLNKRTFVFSKKQSDFISNFKDKYCLYSGGMGCGKTLALNVKMILSAKCFPNNRILLGRKNISDIEKSTLQDLFELMPLNWYRYRVKDNIIQFKNGSQIILFALDALQQGSQADIKKAEQKIKSINLGNYFIDQLEEVEFRVFEALNARMRKENTPRQGNMTCNPANFWAYDYFKANPRPNTFLVEGSMLDNKEHLPEDYLQDRLSMDERWVKRYVYGIWSKDVLLPSLVFGREYIQRFERMKKKPIAIEEECEIYEQPKGVSYQMGIDPSEGAVDPSSISVISSEGKKVAKFNGKITIPGLIEKTRFLYYKYHKPLIIPEANASGAALIEGIKDLKVYRRKQFEYREKRETEKLGFKTTYQSKQALISHFQDLLRQGFPKIYDEKTIEEFKSFVWSDEARQKGAGAEKGFHDDDVMSTLLGFWQLSPQKVDIIRAKRSMPIIKKQFQYF